jgi:nicotinate-nucleotide pyrophosphorylase (carboxylating)
MNEAGLLHWAAPLIELALDEDLGPAGERLDLSAEACLPPGARGRAWIEARQPGVVCGLPLAEEVFRRLGDGTLVLRRRAVEGARVEAGMHLLELAGPLAAILGAERTALNFLQRLSGVATAARRAVDLVPGGPRILDTRKTTPGWRRLEKYAVRCGGAANHRMGLHDMYLIKENHIRGAGGVKAALAAAQAHRRARGLDAEIEIEVETLEQLAQALEQGAERVMLDNFSPEQVAAAVSLAAGRARIEVSGGVTAENLRAYAAAGVDDVSIGALTHSAPAFDCSLLVEEER